MGEDGIGGHVERRSSLRSWLLEYLTNQLELKKKKGGRFTKMDNQIVNIK